MKTMKIKILSTGLILSFLLNVLFFPVKVNKSYTCLFHKVFSSNKNNVQFKIDDDSEMVNQKQAQHVVNKNFLHYYLHRYAFIWWSSLLISTVLLYLIKKEKHK